MNVFVEGSAAEEGLVERFRPLFAPDVIAVAGASTSGTAQGNAFLRQLEAAGFGGRVVIIHPTATTIDGYSAVPSFADVPVPVDYAYIAVPSASVPELIASGEGRVRFAQVISSGFGEGDGAGVDLAAELLRVARETGTRIVGPNSLGTHSPRGGVSFVGGASATDGTISVASQSGGLSVDMIRRGRSLGVRFRGVVSVGNALDVDPIELVDYYLADPGTDVIGLYLEYLPDGRRFVDLLRRAGATKPIVVLKGGQTAQGSRAAASHTGAAATDERLWHGLARQFGVTLVETLDDFLHSLLALQDLAREPQANARDVVLLGNGGGVSVLAADQFARAGLEILPVSDALIRAADAIDFPPGASILNPIDLPAGVFAREAGALCASLLKLVLEQEAPGAIVVHLNLGAMLQGPVFRSGFQGFLDAALPLLQAHRMQSLPVLVLNSDGGTEAEDLRRSLTEEAREWKIPVVTGFAAAIQILSTLNDHEVRLVQTTAASETVLPTK